MIPLRDSNRSTTFPVVNSCIIAASILAFIIELTQGQTIAAFIYRYGLVPSRYADPQLAARFTAGQQVLPFFTSLFLHGGIFHLVGNMWFLYIFGDNVEDRLGHLRYLFFYLLCGLAAGVSHLVINWGANTPTIGASGAIAGVMGAYLVLYPRAKVLTLIPLFFFFPFVEVPAFFFLGIWLLFQLVSAAGETGHVGGVAFWAHIGGFIFGIIFLKLIELVPRMGVQDTMQRWTRKQTTPRLHMIHPVGSGGSLDLRGNMTVSEREARVGGRKLVTFARDRAKRTFSLQIPPGITPGTALRLRGMGKHTAEGLKGDLYLTIEIK
ncbi:MAG: rhomboid family intramembrane serine protease [Deltaproteobacteria bacterium RBG_16_54_18]|nr:MAG: rhomboid family intramembrane serine protease [Deltaproteobacteria bacterium RBG_16_54_18]